MASWFLSCFLLGTLSQTFLKGGSLLRVRRGPHYDPDANVSDVLTLLTLFQYTWCQRVRDMAPCNLHPDHDGFRNSGVIAKAYGAWKALHRVVLSDNNEVLTGEMPAWSPGCAYSSF